MVELPHALNIGLFLCGRETITHEGFLETGENRSNEVFVPQPLNVAAVLCASRACTACGIAAFYG